MDLFLDTPLPVVLHKPVFCSYCSYPVFYSY
jgi:hypothetical protein